MVYKIISLYLNSTLKSTRDAKMSISNRLREVMEIKGLNIKCFSEQLNIPYRTLQNYLLHSRDPSAEVLVKVSEALEVN